MNGLDSIVGPLQHLFDQARDIWIAGGWAMIAIAADAILLFGLGTHVMLQSLRKRFRSIPEREWRTWFALPERRHGALGRIFDYVSGEPSIDASARAFAGLRKTELAPFDRDLRVIKICVAAAPLLGLFGTVTGMLTTFSALASGSGGEKTMAMIARGISEALITTETGLVVALPGLFFHYLLSRQHQSYQAFLAKIETLCNQHLYRQLQRAATAA